jgi:hypothetical protein
MRRRHFREIPSLVALFILVFSSASCGVLRQVQGALLDLQPVYRELANAGYTDVGVSIMKDFSANEALLTVSLVNSPLKALPAAQKNAKALEIARIAYKSYPSASTLRRVIVTFTVYRSYFFGMFTYNNSSDGVSFEIPQLTEGAPPPVL